MKENYLSIEEHISIPNLSDLSISEDGKQLAFVKRSADWNNNTYRSLIWIYERDSGKLYTPFEGTSPSWSPDARSLAYLRPVGEGGVNQIFVHSSDGGSRQITDHQEEVRQFKWDPAGNGFYFVAQAGEAEHIKERKARYGDFQRVGREFRRDCLFYQGMDSVVATQLTDGQVFHVQVFDVSPDGKKVACMATPSPDGEDDQHRNLYILDPLSRAVHHVERDRRLGASVCFSPAGTKVCYTASIGEKDDYQNRIQDSTIDILDLNSGAFTTPLSDVDSAVMPIRWTSKGLLIRWQDKTNYLIGLLSEDGEVKVLTDPADCFILEAAITGNGKHLSYSKATANEIFEMYINDEKITDENHIFEGKRKSNREIISWTSSDELEIEGVLTTPADFDPNKEYPILVLIHGGPAWASFPIHSSCFNDKYPVEQFIEKGFIVLEPNYRGSSGYGNEFMKANYRNFGIGDYQDVISGVDALVDRGIADMERTGIMGWSQGGFISAFSSICSDRFKAASVGGGITNWRNHYVHTDIPYFIRMHLGNTPWHDPEIYARTSPMTYIEQASTPTLIQHGESDARVPVSNAYELYQGLKDMGVNTELIVFKGMAYSSDQPGVNMAVMEQNLMWFSYYVLGERMEGVNGFK